MRRGALNPYFSKAAVAKLEPVIYATVDKLCRCLEQVANSTDSVDLVMAFSCMTTDIVTQYAFAESSNFLDSTTFAPNFHEAILAGTRMGVWARHFPILFPILRSIPMYASDSKLIFGYLLITIYEIRGLLSQLSPEIGIFLRWQEVSGIQSRNIKRRQD